MAIIAVLVGVVPGPTARAGAGPQVEITGVEVGFGGLYKVGEWTPLGVTIRSQSSLSVRLVVDTPDPDGQITSLPSPEFDLSGGAPLRVATCFKTGRMSDILEVRVESGEQVLARQRWRAGPEGPFGIGQQLSVEFWGALGNPGGIDSVEALDDPVHRLDHLVGRVAEPAVLPEHSAAYESLSVLVIAAGAANSGGKLLLADLSDAQNLALEDWVRLGGHLMVAIGGHAKEFQQTRLAAWLPIRVTGQSELRQLDGLETFAGTRSPIRMEGSVPAARFEADGGNVLAQGLDGPLIVQVPFGFGRVTFVALDIDRAPLSDWKALPTVLRKLAGRDDDTPARRQGRESAQLSQLGTTDLVSQLLYTLDDFPQIRRISIWGVLGLILLYLLVIGPLDYILVHRLFKRPDLTWITFPVWVGIAVLVSVSMAGSSNGDKLRLNQLDLIDVDQTSNLVRARTWANIYSAELARYDVRVEPLDARWSPASRADAAARISWIGIPENSIGGLYRPGGLQFGARSYDYAPEAAALEGVPISAWSTKSIGAEWHRPAGPLIESELTTTGVGRLSGTLTYQLPVPLENCMLAFGNRVYFPARRVRGERVAVLAPHQSWDVGQQFPGEQRELRGFLTKVFTRSVERRESKTTDIENKQTPYDPLSHDRDELVRMLTFHQAAGGSSYTSLRHDPLGDLELSMHLRLGRAVLLGRIKEPAARIVLNGEPRAADEHSTFVRFVLPVRQLTVNELEFSNPGEFNSPKP